MSLSHPDVYKIERNLLEKRKDIPRFWINKGNEWITECKYLKSTIIFLEPVMSPTLRNKNSIYTRSDAIPYLHTNQFALQLIMLCTSI